jgi:hypothetical protein
VDNNSAKLIAETEPYRESRDQSRRERDGYHLTGRSQRPREVEDSSWSYTDAAGMYNETEPIRRPRRGSVDREGMRRPMSVIEPAGYPSNYHRGSKDYGPPPTTRQFDKINDIARTSSLRDPARGSSRDQSGTYDSYGHREAYDKPLRNPSTVPIVVNQPEHRQSRDESYYRDEYDEYREPRRPTRQFPDDSVPNRGFGIRAGSVDRYGDSSSPSAEPPVPRSVYPQSSAAYVGEPLVQMPSTSDYVPPIQVDDRRDKPERRDRDRERDRDYERDRPKERERPREREYERDDRERHHHRRFSKDPTDGVRDVAVPTAATAAGVAGIAAAGAAIDKRRSDRKPDSDEERSRQLRHEPNDREDDRERRYSERDREEKRRDEKPREAAIDPDEEYRRRIQQAQVELEGLSLQQSKEDERTDLDHERQRRREREERPREHRYSKDGDSRRGSEENDAPSKSTRSRARGDSIDSQADQQHNRLPADRQLTDRDIVQEPDFIPGAYPRDPPRASTGAMAPPSLPFASVVPPFANNMLPPPDVGPRSKSADPNASMSSSERRVTIVEPPKDDRSIAEQPRVKSILRKPTEKFPEHPNPTREGVTPLKDRLKKEGGGKEIPEGAKWTKVDRRLVNPQALEEKGERFEERQDYVIVLRVLTKDEIQGFANRTNEIRGEHSLMYEDKKAVANDAAEGREDKYSREKRRHYKHRHDDSDSSDEREYRHSSSKRSHEEKEHRHNRDDSVDRERERERESRGSRDEREPRRDDRDRDREPRSSRKDHDGSYDGENEAAMRAIEDGRRGKRESRDLRDEFLGR